MNYSTKNSEMGENQFESKVNYLPTFKNAKIESRLKEELVEYLLNENSESLTRISKLENRFRIMWDTNEYDEESNQWATEIKELWGKLSLIMKLIKDFNLDNGRNHNIVRASAIGGDCYYSVENYVVNLENRILS